MKVLIDIEGWFIGLATGYVYHIDPRGKSHIYIFGSFGVID